MADERFTDQQLLALFNEPTADLGKLSRAEQERLVKLTAPKTPQVDPVTPWVQKAGHLTGTFVNNAFEMANPANLIAGAGNILADPQGTYEGMVKQSQEQFEKARGEHEAEVRAWQGRRSLMQDPL